MALDCATDGVGTADVACVVTVKGNAQSMRSTGIRVFMDELRFVRLSLFSAKILFPHSLILLCV